MGCFDRVLLTVDFDRTLTAPDGSIPQRNLEAIEYFMANGFDTFVCPWESSKNVASAIETVEKLGAFGLMETTWHHLPKMISELLHVNKLLHNSSDNSTNAVLKTETAALLRKLAPANNYEESGWARSQLEFI